MESTWMFWFVLLVFGSGCGSGDCGDVEVDEDGYAKLGHVVVVTVVVVVVVVAVVVVVFLVILILILIMIVVVKVNVIVTLVCGLQMWLLLLPLLLVVMVVEFFWLIMLLNTCWSAFSGSYPCCCWECGMCADCMGYWAMLLPQAYWEVLGAAVLYGHSPWRHQCAKFRPVRSQGNSGFSGALNKYEQNFQRYDVTLLHTL